MNIKEKDNQKIADILKGKEIYIIPYMHADWAWCHNRVWHARRYVAVLEDVLKLVEEYPDFKWYMDCYVTEFEPFLNQRPELLSKLDEYIKKGNIAICGTFSNIRPNIVADEAYIRNMIIGRKKFAGLFPTADLTAHAESVDVALGHPQIPQLLKKAGFKYYRCGRPYNILARKGIPYAFVWQGFDGSEVLCWWGDYNGLTGAECAGKIEPLNDWEGTLEYVFNNEIKHLLDTSGTNIIWVPQGADDVLPLKVFNSAAEINIKVLTDKWRQELPETSMKIATPQEYFNELEKQRDNIKCIKGTIDPCETSINSSFNGEKGLVEKRLRGAETIAEAEKWMTISASINAGHYTDTEKVWEDNLTASAHATQWLYTSDFKAMERLAVRSMMQAEDLRDVATREIVDRMDLPHNVVAVVFNSHSQLRTEIVQFTITCGDIVNLKLVDGKRQKVVFQSVKSYEYTNTIWEFDIIAEITLPPMGYNVIIAESGDIDCRYGAYFNRPEAPATVQVTPGCEFSLENDRLCLEFKEGNLVEILDKDSGAYIESEKTVPWNSLELYHVDTSKGLEFAGPVTGMEKMNWYCYQITESGPVRQTVKLWGTNGYHDYIQEISLFKGKKVLDFKVCTNWKHEGFLLAAIPVERGSRIVGGIPFGIEEKDIEHEYYGQFDGKGGGDIHRQRDGLFFGKDFAAARASTHTVGIAGLTGDRFYIYDKNNFSLGRVLINSVKIPADTWMQHINRESLEGTGNHEFSYAVFIESADTCNAGLVAHGIEMRTIPRVVEPRYSIKTDQFRLPLCKSFIDIDCANLMLSAFYMEGNNYIMRLWECNGEYGTATIATPVYPIKAQAEDFIGNVFIEKNIKVEGNKLSFDVSPYEIITLRLASSL
jgi:hypothetical protein